MTGYIIRRLIQAVIVILIVSIIVFLIMRLLPGDPILIYMSQSRMQGSSTEQLQKLRHEYGLDKPLIAQYLDWLGGILHGDMGRSIFQLEPVRNLIATAFPITVYLGFLSFLISFFLGISAGIISAVRRGTWLDTVVTVLANLGITAPIFWVGIMLIYLFGLSLKWLPIQGYTSPFDNFWLSTKQLMMPVFCLSLFPIASAARQTRSSMLEVIHQDYIRTAWSKGLRERAVIFRHALKNSLIPVITWKGATVRNIFGGSVIIETVFNIPGMGRLAVNGLMEQDYAIIQGVTLIMAIIVTIANLLVDLINGWLDPRVHYE